MQNTIFTPQAIPLISFSNDSQQYELHNEAVQIINAMKGPIAVVGVVGLYRTGKSYLLNRVLLDRSDGFGVGPTVNACTKGIWIWGTPIKGSTADGRPCDILVVDSEGIGALDEDATHDTRIFALVLLLSSVFLYNSQGSIDENAIQSLSLVVNLTKHIQLKHGQVKDDGYTDDEEEVQEEDYRQFLPSFYWILRDFSLQLLDEDGDSITPNEYLTRALAQQRGYADEIEEKNRIRRLLKNFFAERECFPLVRPLLDETKLQDLAQCNVSELRGEFYEQVVELRKRIMQGAQLKTLFGKTLTGAMYTNLVKEYVKEINEGGVPNIQNAWSYLCQQENQKALAEAHRVYQENLQELVLEKLPMDYEELKQSHKMVKEIALEAFKNKSMGEESDQFLQELNKKLKQSFYHLEENNKSASKKVCLEFIQRGYYTIEVRLRPELRDTEYEQEKGLPAQEAKQYTTYKEFKADLDMFCKYLNKCGPKLQRSKEIYLEFLHQKSVEAGQIFNSDLEQELKNAREGTDEQGLKYQRELQERTEEHEREKKELQNELDSNVAEKRKMNLMAEEWSGLKVKIEAEKKNTEKRLKEQEKKALENEKRALALELQQSEEQEGTQQLVRNQKIQMSEWNREKELLLQEKSLMATDNQHLKERERKLEDKFRKDLQQANQEKRRMQQELEEQCAGMRREKSDLQERVQVAEERRKTAEEEGSERRTEYLDREAIWNKKQKDHLKLQAELQRTVQSLKKSIDAAESRSRQDMQMKQDMSSRTQKDMELSQRKLDLTQRKCKDEYEKELVMLNLKMEQANQQAEEYKSMYEQVKKAFDNTISTMQQQPDGQGTDIRSINQLREQYDREKKAQEGLLESSKQKHAAMIEDLSQKVQQSDLAFKMEQAKSEKIREGLQEALEQSQNRVASLQQEIRTYDSKLLKGQENQEGRWRQMVADLENEIEQQRVVAKEEMESQNNRAEDNIREIRLYYENQKEDGERRAREERDKLNKKYYQLNEDWEQRLREEEETREEERDNLTEELRDKEQQFEALIQQCKQELALKQQLNESLESQLKESKALHETFRAQFQDQLQSMQNNLQQENSNIHQKSSQIQEEMQKKENLNSIISQKNEHLQQLVQQGEHQLQADRLSFSNDKQQLARKIDDWKKKYQQLNEDYLDKKIAFEKESALIKQQNSFMSQKVEELQSQIDSIGVRADEKLKLTREELLEECRDKVSYARDEKKNLEDKLERLKKSFKTNETIYIKKISELEKESEFNRDKHQTLEQKHNELLSKHSSDTQQYQTQLQSLNDQYASEKKPLHTELQKFQTLNEKLENDKNDLVQMHEREKIYMEGKLSFLQNQKDVAKNELQEQQKKFEITLQHFQSARKNEKSLQDNSLNDMIQQIENKYQNQLQEQQQYGERQTLLYEDKIRKLEKELRMFQDNNMLEKQGNMGNQYLNEKKFTELLDNEKKLMKEIETLKNERESKVAEYQRVLEKDRENYRVKINEWEQKIKDSEKKRSQLIFEQEKERAKWNMDKDNLLAHKGEMQDHVEKLERKKDFLVKDNERLKNDVKNKRMMGSQYLGNSNVGTALSGLQGMLSGKPGMPPMVRQSYAGGLGSNLGSNSLASFNQFRKNNQEDDDISTRKKNILDNIEEQQR